MSEPHKVVFCVPTIARPHEQTLASLAAAAQLLDDVGGFAHAMVSEVGNPYISNARNTMLRKALDWGADSVVFIDHDVSFPADAILKLLQAQGDCIAGLYRFTKAGPPEAEHSYMGTVFSGESGSPLVRDDGCIKAELVPAGFLRITRTGVNLFMGAYPELMYGERCRPHVDLFNHGAHNWLWYGEDYAMSRRWREGVGDIWIVPDLDLTHWRGRIPYRGNFHSYMMRQPGGRLHEKATWWAQ